MKLTEKKLGREKALGMADMDEDGKEVVIIDPRQCSKERLDTIIHEFLHLVCPTWSEKKVIRESAKLKGMMWKDGWRKVAK
jgi:hypothetical protein